MVHLKIFGILEIISGLIFVLANFGIIVPFEINGFNSTAIVSLFVIVIIIFNLIASLIKMRRKIMQIIVSLFFVMMPLIYVINQKIPIIETLPINENFLLIMGILTIINGIFRLL